MNFINVLKLHLEEKDYIATGLWFVMGLLLSPILLLMYALGFVISKIIKI